MKRYLAWDIETVPTALSLSLPYPEAQRHPPKNYKKPEAIASWREQDREDWEESRIKGYSFSPRTSRIVAISLNYRGQEFIDLSAPTEADEKAMIEQALTVMLDLEMPSKRARNDVLVGYNSKKFDWPFLMHRMLKNRIDPFAIESNGHIWVGLNDRYSKRNLDALELVNFGQFTQTPGSLSDWGEHVNMPSKETDGSMIYDWWVAGDIGSIKKHCRGDAHRTGAIFEYIYPLSGLA